MLKNEFKIGKNIFFGYFMMKTNWINFVFWQIFVFIIIAIAYSSAGKIPAPKERDCIQIGNYDGRDFKEHRCPMKWYVAGLQFVGHQNQESAYVITCCQDIWGQKLLSHIELSVTKLSLFGFLFLFLCHFVFKRHFFRYSGVSQHFKFLLYI